MNTTYVTKKDETSFSRNSITPLSKTGCLRQINSIRQMTPENVSRNQGLRRLYNSCEDSGSTGHRNSLNWAECNITGAIETFAPNVVKTKQILIDLIT